MPNSSRGRANDCIESSYTPKVHNVATFCLLSLFVVVFKEFKNLQVQLAPPCLLLFDGLPMPQEPEFWEAELNMCN